jgi:ubiquinone/menaquinone biosynthesis C-methylase UbiE
MPSYWDRFASTYSGIGEAKFWLNHRLRITDHLSGRAIEMCCGGGQLVLELLKKGIDAYGIDLSPKMVELAQVKLVNAGFEPERIIKADVTKLPFKNGEYDVVISTGSIALFNLDVQKNAIREMARISRKELRLLESIEKKKGFYWGRILAFMFDGMHPIPKELFEANDIECKIEWDIFGGAFSFIKCTKK